MRKSVDIEFDCVPLRSITRWDAPLDASPQYHQLLKIVKQAADKHGLHNTYFLHNARCTFFLTNAANVGMLEFRFHGVVLTDSADRRTRGSDLEVKLVRGNVPPGSGNRSCSGLPKRWLGQWKSNLIATLKLGICSAQSSASSRSRRRATNRAVFWACSCDLPADRNRAPSWLTTKCSKLA